MCETDWLDVFSFFAHHNLMYKDGECRSMNNANWLNM